MAKKRPTKKAPAKKRATARRPRKKPKAKAKAAATAPPLTKVPAPPERLGAYGRAYWQRITPLLVKLKLLTELHLESLEALCDQWDEYQKWKAYLAEDPSRELFTTEKGYEQETPAVRARNRALWNLQRMWAKFGLTPDSQAKLDKSAGDEDQDWLTRFALSKYDDEEDLNAGII